MFSFEYLICIFYLRKLFYKISRDFNIKAYVNRKNKTKNFAEVERGLFM